jgi:hypothetical protein
VDRNLKVEKWQSVVDWYTVKLGGKERLDKEQLGVQKLFTDYHPFRPLHLLLDNSDDCMRNFCQ